MSAEVKFYPMSNESRETALMLAFMTNESVVTNNPLTQRTKDRLIAVHSEFMSKIQTKTGKKAHSSGLIADKEKMRDKTVMYCSHFFQVLNLCIKRGEYPAAIRALYQMEVESDKLPLLKSEYQIANAAETIIKGEAAWVAQGGVPMSRPSAVEVKAVYTVYKGLISAGSNSKDALDNAQEDVQRLNKEVDKVIKKVWNEVETFYSESTREHMREHARRWGVVYARKGYLKKITGTVTDSATGLPLPGVRVKLSNGRNKALTNSEGRFTLNTILMHEQILSASLKDYDTIESKVMLHEDKGTVCNLQMSKVG